MAGRRRGNEPWGEGFAQDGWSSIAAVDRWEHLTPDEYIRYFPRLGGRPGPLPAPVLAHLTEAVAVRVWRRGPNGAGLPLAGLDAPGLTALGARVIDGWFAPPSLMERAVGWLTGHAPAGHCPAADDVGGLQHLAGLLAVLRAGSIPDYAESAAIAVAFHGGLHPAYLWGEAATWAESATTAGWLGVLARGRSALMPAEAIAPLMDAVVVAPDGSARLRDLRFTSFGFSSAQWGALALAARGVADGRGMVVRLIPAGRRAPVRTGTNDPPMPAAAVTLR